MFRKKSPRLAAAFVVTISAGCGGATTSPENGTTGTATTDTDGTKKPEDPKKPDGPENPDWVPNIGSVKGGPEKDADGKCFIVHPANPPWREPVDCATQEPLKKPDGDKPTPPQPDTTATPPKADDTNLEDAPSGWRIEHNSDGTCTAYGPMPQCRPGWSCNPPRPRKVKCSSANVAK